MAHPALAVRGQERSRRFYETYLGFDAGPAWRAPDGVLLVKCRGPDGYFVEVSWEPD